MLSQSRRAETDHLSAADCRQLAGRAPVRRGLSNECAITLAEKALSEPLAPLGVDDTEENRKYRGRRVRLYENADGDVELIECDGQALAFTIHRKDARVTQSQIVEHKHLGAVLAQGSMDKVQNDPHVIEVYLGS